MSAPTPLRREEVEALVSELAPLLIGSRVEKVYDRPPHAFLFRFRGASGRRHLLLTTRPGHSRFHLVEEVGTSPPAPSPAAQELRTLLGGARVVSIDQPGGDRLARWRFARGAKGTPSVAVDLIFELFGRAGRLLVIDEESRRVRFRHGRGGIGIGEPYRFPEPPVRGEDSAPTLPFQPRSLVPEELRDGDAPFHRFTEVRMREAELRDEREARRRGTLTRLRREGKRRQKLLEKLERDLESAQEWEMWQRRGELLKGHLGEMRRGHDAVEVTDWYAAETPRIVISLDPTRTPTENIEVCFRRARKGKRSITPLEERLAILREEIAAIDGHQVEIDATPEDPPEEESAVLDRVEDWLRGRERRSAARAPGARRTREPVRSGPKRFRTRQGLTVLAGRNARENDELSIRTAKGNDLFFHRADRPGPHVILQVPKGTRAAPESIDDAAYIAAYLSGWRGPGDARVQWTEAKNVRKPKGLPPGKVLVHRARDHQVGYENDRIGTLGIEERGAGGS